MSKDIELFYMNKKIGTATNVTDDLLYYMKHISFHEYSMFIYDKDGRMYYVFVRNYE